MTLDTLTRKIYLIILLQSYQVELLSLKVKNTKLSIDDMKFQKNHSKVKVIIKNILNTFWSNLHFKKDELKEIFTIGIQVIGI